MFFSKYKILSHVATLDHFYAGDKPAPVTVDIEPSNICNLSCRWCYPMLQGWRKKFTGRIERDILLRIPKFFSDWGSKTIVITGGGEPLLHPDISDFFQEIKRTNLKIGLITNGTLLNNKLFDPIKDQLEWIGFSIDSGNKESFRILKGKDEFNTILSNARYIRKNSNVDLSYKFLVTTDNFKDILEATKIAQSAGFNRIYIRPAIGVDKKFTKSEKETYKILLEKTLRLETPSFKILINNEKTNEEFDQELYTIPSCLASPTLITICANGKCYWCQDHRGEERWEIADLNNDFSALIRNWGSLEHISAIRNIHPSRDCARCTFKSYNEVLLLRNELFLDYL